MSARGLFARAALLAYPAEFRSHFGSQLVADIEDDPESGAASFFDMLKGGCAMRADALSRDVAYAVRRLRAAPLFVAIVVLTFALGIGANVAVFSVLNAIVLKPLPYVNSSRLVALRAMNTNNAGQHPALSVLDVSDIRSQEKSFTQIAGAVEDSATILSSGKPISLEGMAVMPAYFSILGITPQFGRVLDSSDLRPGEKPIVISDGMWRKFFAADPAAVGKVATLDGVAYRIVGVTKPGQLFVMPASAQIGRPDYFVPLPETALQRQRGSRYIGAIARLAPGSSVESADAELRLISARLQKMFPDQNTGFVFDARSLDSVILGDTGSALWTIFAGVIGILLIACANVANVLGARWSTRGREFALRRALGATSGRIAAQLFTETAMLAALGGIAGVLLAWIGISVFGSGVLRALPRSSDIRIDGATLLYAAAIVVATTVLAGLIPVMTSNDRDLHSVLKTAGRGGGGRGQRLRSTLVVAEIALTLAVVTVSGLMIRSYVQVTHTPLGIRSEGLYVSDVVSLPEHNYPTLAARSTLHRDLLARLRALPGVDSAALAVQYPLGDFSLHFNTALFGEHYPQGMEPTAAGNDVSPGYFKAAGVPVLRGRDFSDGDTMSAAPVAIVNDAFVKKFIRAANPIGVRIRIAGWNGTTAHWAAIVGVVGDERERLLRPPDPMIYSPIAQAPVNYLSAVVHAPNVDRRVLASELTAAFARSAPAMEPPGLYTMDERIALGTRAARTSVLLLSILAVVALLLAITGVFGVVSFSVSQRLHEFGIRMALGARSTDIVSDVLRRAAMTTSIGIALGLIVAALCVQAIASQLREISPFDPPTFVGVVIVLFLSASVAALQPAIRATRVEPAMSLRYE